MSTQLVPHYTPEAGSSVGAIVSNFNGEAIIASNTTVPADGATGYAEGCLFFKENGIAGEQLYINSGTPLSANFDPLPSGAANAAGAGITSGTGTVIKSSVTREGEFVVTRILIDITGLSLPAGVTQGDIIGSGASPAYLTQITAAKNGTIFMGRMVCIEAQTVAIGDIDLYAANEGTGVRDGAIGDLTETQLVNTGAIWASGTSRALIAMPAANSYLYLTAGDTSEAPGTYGAGQFMIELWGT